MVKRGFEGIGNLAKPAFFDKRKVTPHGSNRVFKFVSGNIDKFVFKFVVVLKFFVDLPELLIGGFKVGDEFLIVGADTFVFTSILNGIADFGGDCLQHF